MTMPSWSCHHHLPIIIIRYFIWVFICHTLHLLRFYPMTHAWSLQCWSCSCRCNWNLSWSINCDGRNVLHGWERDDERTSSQKSQLQWSACFAVHACMVKETMKSFYGGQDKQGNAKGFTRAILHHSVVHSYDLHGDLYHLSCLVAYLQLSS